MLGNPVTILSDHTINRGDRLFDSMNDLTIIIASVAHAVSVLAGGMTHRTPQPVGRINTTQFDYAFALRMRGPVEFVMRDKMPDSIKIGRTPLANTKPALADVVVESADLIKITSRITSPIFLLFFERYNVWLTDTYGDGKNWPMTLNFARVIRNAIAHGSITVRSPSTPPVHWRGLKYGYADNGKSIMGTDLIFGDMLGLMFEVDEELDKLGVPIL